MRVDPHSIDPASKTAVPCKMLDKTFATSLTERVLEQGEHAGVDYWWEDYGIGGPKEGEYKVECTAEYPPPHTAGWGHCMSCFDDDPAEKPALWSGYVHGSRLTRQKKRALLLGINGGLGHHRYPGVGSGDVYETWETLSFEIYLSLTAANTVVEWNHDLGGFMRGDDSLPGPIDPHTNARTWLHNPERYARWLQAGVFQGIFRTHQSFPGDPTPWHYPNFEVLREAFQLRNALGPYIYTAAWQAYMTGTLPCHPMYYDFPEEEMAYTLSTLRGPDQALQHSFGNDFVVAPITAAAASQPSPPVPAPPTNCTATSAGDGLDTHAAVLAPLVTPDADGCAAACCARSQCTGYTFDPAQDDNSGDPICKIGKPCCWLKQGRGNTFHSKRTRLNSAVFSAPPPPPQSTGVTEWPLWVPPGRWAHWFTGELHTGPTTLRGYNYTETEIPLLVRAGAIIPMKTLDAAKDVAPDRLRLEVVWAPGATGNSSVYEDSGEGLGYQTGEFCLTHFAIAITGHNTTLAIGDDATPPCQPAVGLPAQRRFEVRFRNPPLDAAGWSFAGAAAVGSSWWWEQAGAIRTLVGVTAMVDRDSGFTATFTHGSAGH